MSDRLLEVDHVSKQYRLGMIGGGMLYRDLNSWIARKLGREDPNRKIGVSSSHDGETFLALEGLDNRVKIEWDDISLQDITQEAQAELYRAQAEKYRKEAKQ